MHAYMRMYTCVQLSTKTRKGSIVPWCCSYRSLCVAQILNSVIIKTQNQILG